MTMPLEKSQRGFTLLEFMVASAVGLIVIMAMTQLFRMGMNATFTVTQRAETQQNLRAAIELMTKDISMAGAAEPAAWGAITGRIGPKSNTASAAPRGSRPSASMSLLT